MATRDREYTAHLEVQATISDVRLASEWLAGFGALHAVPEAQISRLDLCLNEALANVIAHGGEAAHAQPVHLQMRIATQQAPCEASITVSDAGPAFDMAHAPLGERPQTLAEAEPGGLGLLMLRSFSDALTYQRTDGRNALTFCVHWI